MLNVSNLNVKHGELAVVNNVSLHIHTSEIVAVVGGNGAGKTSLARAIVGLSRAHGGSIEITRDKVIERLNGKPTWAIARKGVVYVPETKPVFELPLRLTTSCQFPGPSCIHVKSPPALFKSSDSAFVAPSRRYSMNVRQVMPPPAFKGTGG